MNIRDLIEADLEYQEKMKVFYEKEIKSLPIGSLYARDKKGFKEFYFVESKTRKRTYIGRNKINRLEKLYKSKQFGLALKRCEENIKIEQRFLEKYNSIDAVDINEELPRPYQWANNLIKQAKGSNDSLKKKQKLIEFTGTVMHTATNGLNVRSKSETLIVDRLVIEKIDFEYEKELVLKEYDGRFRRVLPDFTFRDWMGREIYWEHFGLLKDPVYSQKAYEKLILYAKNGILPGTNLFITADSIDGGIDVSSIYNTVKLLKEKL